MAHSLPRFLSVSAAAVVAVALTACGGGGGGGDSASPAPVLAAPTLAFTAPGQTVEVANYVLTGRYSLPVGTVATNRLAEEASGITYNKDTDTLFVVGDGGTAVVQVSKQGVLVNSMVFGATTSGDPAINDPEGIAYIGGGKFVVVEERLRQLNEFSYVAGGTLLPAAIRRVKLGTTIGNIGIEGVGFDAQTGGFVAVKESGPSGIFQTTVDFAAGTASNGSATTENSTNLFDPALLGLTALNDVFALSNVLPTGSTDYGQLLVLSAPDGKVVQVDRTGRVVSTLNVGATAQNEGMVMDSQRSLYVVSEIGGGTGKPEMLVYAPTTSANAVGPASNLYLNFSQAISAGTGNLTISNGAGDTRTIAVTDASQVRISGSTLTLNPTADLLAGGTYSITYAAGVVRDSAGNGAAAVSDAAALRFKVVGSSDTSAPLLGGSNPADDAVNVPVGPIRLDFNEAVVAGTGNIVIGSSADTRTIAVTDTAQVSISGSTVTVTPTTPLRANTAYNVQMASGVIRDVAGNAYAGITSATTLNFTTAAAPATLLTAGDIAFIGANADSPDAFAFVLLKAITAGTQIGFTDRDLTATGFPASGEAAYVWTASTDMAVGTIVTIQPDSTTPVANTGTVMGAGGGISQTAETVYAFQGSITGLTATAAGAITVDRFIAAINVGGAAAGVIPAELTGANASISFPGDNVLYTGSRDISDLAAFIARIRNTANYGSSDSVPFPITNNSLFP